MNNHGIDRNRIRYIKRIGDRNRKLWRREIIKTRKAIHQMLYNINSYLGAGTPINNIVLGVALERLEYQFESLSYSIRHYQHWKNQYVVYCNKKNK